MMLLLPPLFAACTLRAFSYGAMLLTLLFAAFSDAIAFRYVAYARLLLTFDIFMRLPYIAIVYAAPLLISATHTTLRS